MIVAPCPPNMMMGDGTEEQNLDERGNPSERIKGDEVASAFSKKKSKK